MIVKLLMVCYCFFFRNVEGALNEFTPDIIVYNAGTDILDGDPLGTLSISPQVSTYFSYIMGDIT